MIIREEHLSEKAMCRLPDGMWQNAVFYDIETTGLGWRSSHIYLIGLLYRSDDGWVLRQWFLDHPFAEKEMLLDVSDFVTEYRRQNRSAFLVDYNGTTFDLPYLRNKFLYYTREIPDLLRRDSAAHIDLMQMLRPLRAKLPLTSLRLQEIEQMLSTPRRDAATGKELIPVYEAFLKTGENALLDQLFLHNRDDVAGLPHITALLAFREFWSGHFSVATCEDTQDALLFTLVPEQPFPLCYSLCGHPVVPVSEDDSGYAKEKEVLCTLSFCEASALLSVPVIEGERKLFFRDYKNYVYLPAEDQAVHRSVGIFTDPAFREAAKAATCYRRVSGRFVPVTGPISGMTMFYRKYRDQTGWIRTEELLSGNAKVMHDSICAILAENF